MQSVARLIGKNWVPETLVPSLVGVLNADFYHTLYMIKKLVQYLQLCMARQVSYTKIHCSERNFGFANRRSIKPCNLWAPGPGLRRLVSPLTAHGSSPTAPPIRIPKNALLSPTTDLEFNTAESCWPIFNTTEKERHQMRFRNEKKGQKEEQEKNSDSRTIQHG